MAMIRRWHTRCWRCRQPSGARHVCATCRTEAAYLTALVVADAAEAQLDAVLTWVGREHRRLGREKGAADGT